LRLLDNKIKYICQSQQIVSIKQMTSLINRASHASTPFPQQPRRFGIAFFSVLQFRFS
jgi:hypothetical protein